MEESESVRRTRLRAAFNLTVLLTGIGIAGLATIFGWSLGCREYFTRTDSAISCADRQESLTEKEIRFIDNYYKCIEQSDYSCNLDR